MKLPFDSESPTQIPMPGIPITQNANANPGNVYVGREILYMSRRKGGPRFGARGIIKEVSKRRAVVDLGQWGTWNVPYSFLSIPHELNQNAISSM